MGWENARRLIRRGTPLAIAVSLTAWIGTGRSTPGMSYMLTVTSNVSGQGGEGREVIVRAHGVATANAQRLDVDSIRPNSTLLLPQDYFLMLDTGRTTLVALHNGLYTNEFDLEGAAGVHAAIQLGALEVSDLPILKFQARLVPLADEVVSGRHARHFKITIEYSVMSQQEEIPYRTVVEVWMAQLPVKLLNPFEEVPLLDSAGPLRSVYGQLDTIRKQLGGGAALKTVTTTTIYYAAGSGRRAAGEASLDVVETSEFSGLKDTVVDSSAFTIPRHFQKSG